jgi:hypothetical protein
MKHRNNAGAPERLAGARFLRLRSAPCCCLAFACCTALSAHFAEAQSSITPGGALRTDKVDLPTPINQPPDAIAQMKSREHRAGQQKFDIFNALRQRQIADETLKLLILARDLKSQMDNMGAQPMPARLLREAEVIEILARDVQAKMTLTVGAG